MGRVLVTGARTAVGQATIELLRRAGVAVRTATRRPDARDSEARYFDWHDPLSQAQALERVDALFLLVPERLGEAAAAVVPFVERAVVCGVSRIVLLSALGVEVAGEETGMFAIEDAVRASSARWTILRPNTFMQNFSTGSFAPAIQTQSAVVAPMGDARVSFIDARDIGAVAAAVLTQDGYDGAEYELTGAEALSFDEVAEVLSRAAGRRIAYQDVSPEAMQAALHAGGMSSAQVDLLSRFFAGLRSGRHAIVHPTVAAITGRAPRSFDEFAAEHAHYWRSSE